MLGALSVGSEPRRRRTKTVTSWTWNDILKIFFRYARNCRRRLIRCNRAQCLRNVTLNNSYSCDGVEYVYPCVCARSICCTEEDGAFWSAEHWAQRTPINWDIEKALHLIISLTGTLPFIWTQHSKVTEQLKEWARYSILTTHWCSKRALLWNWKRSELR